MQPDRCAKRDLLRRFAISDGERLSDPGAAPTERRFGAWQPPEATIHNPPWLACVMP